MNDNSNAKTMYETVPAAAELNKVPGFDPLKFLRRTKDALKLDLPYQKLWFRMAHPNGRMRLTALRITEQMAIFEARVFLDRSDTEPFSVSVAQQSNQDSRNFVQAAQNEALSQALTDAGFGIQLVSADVQETAAGKNTGVPAEKAAGTTAGMGAPAAGPQKPVSAPQSDAVPAKGDSPTEVVETLQRAPEAAETASNANPSAKVPEKQSLPVEPAVKADRLPVEMTQTGEHPAPASEKAEDRLPVPQEEAAPADESMQEQPVAEPAQAAATAPAYTQDTPMEDILKVMTLEQAQQVVVDDGICKGMTIAQVAEKRPVNLRFYLIPGKSKNNMVRAAAQLVLDSLQKAG